MLGTVFDLVVSSAVAQPIGTAVVAVTPTTDITAAVIAAAHTFGVAVLTVFAGLVTKIFKDQAARKTVLTAAENAVAYAENRIGAHGPYTAHVASAVGRLALSYVNAHVGDAVKRLGLDDASVSRIIIAKMPAVNGTIDENTMNGIVASASGKAPAPVDFGPLLAVLTPAIKQAIAEHFAEKKPPVIDPLKVSVPKEDGTLG